MLCTNKHSQTHYHIHTYIPANINTLTDLHRTHLNRHTHPYTYPYSHTFTHIGIPTRTNPNIFKVTKMRYSPRRQTHTQAHTHMPYAHTHKPMHANIIPQTHTCIHHTESHTIPQYSGISHIPHTHAHTPAYGTT